jgi:hypothetical protein
MPFIVAGLVLVAVSGPTWLRPYVLIGAVLCVALDVVLTRRKFSPFRVARSELSRVEKLQSEIEQMKKNLSAKGNGFEPFQSRYNSALNLIDQAQRQLKQHPEKALERCQIAKLQLLELRDSLQSQSTT